MLKTEFLSIKNAIIEKDVKLIESYQEYTRSKTLLNDAIQLYKTEKKSKEDIETEYNNFK